ncbi:transposase [Saccharopolyspora shandongensis]|uniref:transposase n=1 Tax=Saccharopolyspora shandongensis TaxID=418495 RepID=UPI001FE6DA29|nr:transposase [Saccharopolyspora shandongensis]
MGASCWPTPAATCSPLSATPAAYAGLAPVPRDSGRVRGNLHRPKRYHRGLRRVFYLAALSSIKRPGSPSRGFYQRKVVKERFTPRH